MARKPKAKPSAPKTPDLPGVSGQGVAPLSIPDIDKVITKYERAKEKRCQASPDEMAAKQSLQIALHTHRGALPLNGDGLPFYRYDDVDYILEETLKRRRVSDGSDGDN